MLSFTEELVLLLNDEDGVPLPIRQDVVACALAGAVLMDLAFDYRIDTDFEALVVHDRTPTSNAVLDRLLAKIAARAEVCDTKAWIGILSAEEAPAVQDEILAGLVEQGVLTIRSSKFPWMGSRRRPGGVPAASRRRR